MINVFPSETVAIDASKTISSYVFGNLYIYRWTNKRDYFLASFHVSKIPNTARIGRLHGGEFYRDEPNAS